MIIDHVDGSEWPSWLVVIYAAGFSEARKAIVPDEPIELKLTINGVEMDPEFFLKRLDEIATARAENKLEKNYAVLELAGEIESAVTDAQWSLGQIDEIIREIREVSDV